MEDAVKAIRNRHIVSRAESAARREGGGIGEKKEKKGSAGAASSEGTPVHNAWLPAGNAGGPRNASKNALSGDYEGTSISKQRRSSPALQLRMLTLARCTLYWR